MAARAYLLQRQPKHPLVFVPSDTPVSEVVGRMNRLLRGTELEVIALHEAMGFAYNRDNLVRKGGRFKKAGAEEEEEEAAAKRPDLLTAEDQVCMCACVFVRILVLVGDKFSHVSRLFTQNRSPAPWPPLPLAPAAAPTPGRPPSSSPAWRQRAGWTLGAPATVS